MIRIFTNNAPSDIADGALLIRTLKSVETVYNLF